MRQTILYGIIFYIYIFFTYTYTYDTYSLLIVCFVWCRYLVISSLKRYDINIYNLIIMYAS